MKLVTAKIIGRAVGDLAAVLMRPIHVEVTIEGNGRVDGIPSRRPMSSLRLNFSSPCMGSASQERVASQAWTLLDDDWELLANKTGASRLVFALSQT